ncbi:MAG: DUF4097 family beta strand repeat-containing protein [Oscillospiraceae bacterium]
MKTWKKMALTLGVCMVAVGAIVMGAGYAMGGRPNITLNAWNHPINFGVFGTGAGAHSDSVIIDEANLDAFTKLNIFYSYGDIRVETGSTYSLKITGNPEGKPTYTLENGTLTVKGSPTAVVGIDLRDIDSTIVITVPSDAKLKEVTVDADAGSVRLFGITAERLKVTDSFGDVRVENGTFGTVKISLDSGSLRMSNSTVTEGTLDNSFGEIRGEALASDDLTVTNDSGEVDLQGKLGSVKVTCSFGEIRVKTSLKASEFGYDLATDFGEIRVDGEKVGTAKNTNAQAPYTMKLQNDCGDIRVEFDA